MVSGYRELIGGRWSTDFRAARSTRDISCAVATMLSLFSAAQAFTSPTVMHVAPQPVRSSPPQMMEMPSRRAALLSAAALAVPFAANANPEDYVGGCACINNQKRRPPPSPN